MSTEPDLHVQSLTYSLCPLDSVTYNNPPPIDVEIEHALLHLSDNKLVCTMMNHFGESALARAAVEPFLRSWEVAADLQSNRGAIRFKYETANVIDRTPVIPGTPRHHFMTLESGSFVLTGGSAKMVVGMSHYPAPANRFALTPNAESLWLRYIGYLEGREPLLSMAYFCLTVLESSSGGRGAASKRYRIAEKVLRKLGELTATRGDRLSARKASARPQQSLSGAESAWIQSVVKALILRAGEEPQADSADWIDFPDLPAI